jgi:hypothetical protein
MKRIVCTIFFLLMTVACLGSVEFGLIADIHFSDQADELLGGDYRMYSTASARFAAAIATWNAASVAFSVNLGDVVAQSTTDPCTYYGTFATAAGTLSADHYVAIGNHDDNANNEADYFNETWGIPTVLPAYPAANTWYSGSADPCQPWAYTAVDSGIRLVAIANVGVAGVQFSDTDNDGGVDQKAWLTDNGLDTALPVVVISHANPRGITAFTDVVTDPCVVGADGLVVAVFAGHDHTTEQVVESTSIPYIDMGASVTADGLTGDDAARNLYYIVEVSTNLYLGVDQRRAYIEITPYGRGGEQMGKHVTIPSDGRAFEWKLNDLGGTTCTDAKGASNGTAANTIVNGARGACPVAGNVSTVFNGSSDYIDAADKLISDVPYSVSAWFKSSAATDQEIFAIEDKDVTNKYFSIRLESTGVISTPVRISAVAEISNGTTETYNDGKWHHVIVVWASNSSRKIYVDGKLKYEDTATKDWISSASDHWTIGRLGDSTPGNYFNGELDQVNFYPYALDAQKVRVECRKGVSRGRRTPRNRYRKAWWRRLIGM